MTESVFFDDLVCGQSFATGFSRVIDTDMVAAYFRLTADCFGIHRDDAVARRYGLERAMVPGNLVTAIATGLVYEAGYFSDTLVVQARKTILYRQPVYTGERIRVVDRVVDLERTLARCFGTVILDRCVVNEADETVQRIEQEYRIAVRQESTATNDQRTGSTVTCTTHSRIADTRSHLRKPS
jgi:acyl dehydratase